MLLRGIVTKQLRHGLLAATLGLALSACLPGANLEKAQEAEEIDLVEKFAQALAQTSISRRSGSATLMRLKQLFPTGSAAILNPDHFHSAKGTELNRALGAIDRPVNAVAMMALRTKATALCKTHVGTGADSSNIFNLEGKPGLAPALLVNETAPGDEPTYMAMAAVRRVWMSLASASASEVRELARLYSTVLQVTSDARQAKRAVCEAAILAPQFWMGVPGDEDAAIRVAVEIGNRVPTHQELADIRDNKLSLRQLTQRVQQEAGYYKSVRGWHEEWLGLRPFMAQNSDFRTNSHDYGSADQGASKMAGVAFAVGADDHLSAASQAHVSGEVCTTEEQEFDPRTGFTYWEHDRADPAGSWIVGAWVAPGSLETYIDHVLEKYSAQGYLTDDPNHASYAAARTLVSNTCVQQSGVKDYDNGQWYLCQGLVPLTATEYTDVTTRMQAQQTEVLRWQQLAIVQRKTSTDNTMKYYAGLLVGAAEAAGWNAYQGYLGGIRKGYEDLFATRLPSWGTQRFYRPDLTGLRRTVGAAATSSYERGTIRWLNDFDWQIRGIGKNFSGQWSWLYRDRASALTGPTSGATEVTEFSGGQWVGVNGAGNLGESRHTLAGFGTFNVTARKARRFTPDGEEQNGRSRVRLWYSGAEVTVCNAATRYFATCAYRPPSGVGLTSDLQNWNAADPRVIHLSLFGWSNNGGFTPHAGMYMYCGEINAADVASGTYDSTRKVFDAGYSRGGPGNLNDLVFAPFYGGNYAGNGGASYVAEMRAMGRIHTDMTEEPYYLMEHLLRSEGDYREMLTAEYSCGSEELADLYRSQGYFLAKHPRDLFGGVASSGNCAGTSPDGRPLLKFQLTENDRIPLQMLRHSDNGWPNGFIVYEQQRAQGETHMGTKPMSGILGMPAMLTPVAPNMRTISSRYFLRLLCGDPSMYKQEGLPEGDDVQECDNEMCDYIPAKQKAAHLSVPCLGCHINMDPLASALSYNFLEHIGDYYKEHQGEMIGFAPAGLSHPGTNLAYGIRGGGPKGTGFFTRVPMNRSSPEVVRVSGVREVARELAESRDFAKCVVQKAFLNVFGRQPAFTDADFLDRTVSEFGREGYNYNELIRDLVDSETFRRKN